jgi:60 kDa SS-A/Ro ribonucleoprotein
MAAGVGDESTRQAALEALPRVARTGTHLFRFVTFAEQFRGWGRSLRRAVGRWYASRPVDALAYQAVKYRQREGVTHRDLLRLAHPAVAVSAGNPTLEVSREHAALFEWIVRGTAADGLPREALRPEHLTSAEVWSALLEEMPMTALIRNLATMTRVGVIAPGSECSATVVGRLGDRERIRNARVHPIAVLAALRTYSAGRGARGRGEWNPVREIVDALDAAFYTAFENVEQTGQRLLLALDVSGSMTFGEVAGVPGLTPRDASAALALLTAATEARYDIVAFAAGEAAFRKPGRRLYPGYADGLAPLATSPRERLDDAVEAVSSLPFGGADCALPMLYAPALQREVDTFVIHTDSETWAGDIHPVQALRDYRQASGIDARLVVVGMVSNGFSIADPADRGMLDVVGFDTATPQLIADFARGTL